MIEKNGFFGGVTATSGHVIQAYNNPVLRASGVLDDTAAAFFEFLKDMALGQSNVSFLQHIAYTSLNTFNWLVNMGVRFANVPHNSWDGWPVHRAVAWREPLILGDGSFLTIAMVKHAEQKGITLIKNLRAESLIQKGAPGTAVTGVVARDRFGGTVTINADAVILATGGYSQNFDLISVFSPALLEAGFFPPTGPTVSPWGRGGQVLSFVTGDGHIMGMEAGAGTVKGALMVGISGQRNHAVFVTPRGVRFTDEAFTYLTATASPMWILGYHYHWSVWGTNTNPATPVAGALSAPSLEELADAMGLVGADKAAFVNEINQYNSKVWNPAGQGSIIPNGYRNLNFYRAPYSLNGQARHQPVLGPTYFAVRTGPGQHHTNWWISRGGLKINIDGKVLTGAGSVIPGLFAAGEVANGDTLPAQYGGSGMALTVYANMARRVGWVAAGETWPPPGVRVP